jgi:hypothetical protein
MARSIVDRIAVVVAGTARAAIMAVAGIVAVIGCTLRIVANRRRMHN